MKVRSIVVIGTSAGGFDALTRLVAQLPKDFAAPVFIVRHAPARADVQTVVEALNKCGKSNVAWLATAIDSCAVTSTSHPLITTS